MDPSGSRPRGRPPGTQVSHREFADKLRTQLDQGAFKSGSVFPSYRTLARKHKVGNQAAWLAVELLKEEGRLVPNGRRRLTVAGTPAGHSLGTSFILEIMGANLSSALSDYTIDIQTGIQRGAGDLARPLMILHGHRLLQEKPRNLSRFPAFGIVLLRNLAQATVRQYENAHVPVVLVDRPGADWKMHSVAVRNAEAAYEAAMRLVAFGHRRFALVRYASYIQKGLDPDSKERQAGFLQAMQASGIGSEGFTQLTYTSKTEPSSAGWNALFVPKHRPTAIVCVSYAAARVVKHAIEQRGLQVPKDYSLVCFQGTKAEEPHISGPRIDFEKLGRLAVNLLAQPKTPYQHLRIPAVWHEGITVAQPG